MGVDGGKLRKFCIFIILTPTLQTPVYMQQGCVICSLEPSRDHHLVINSKKSRPILFFYNKTSETKREGRETPKRKPPQRHTNSPALILPSSTKKEDCCPENSQNIILRNIWTG